MINMVIVFSSPDVRNHLIENRVVYTYRRGGVRKRVGKDWANSGRGTKKIMDVMIEPVDEVLKETVLEQLSPYVENSGFNSTEKWVDVIKSLNNKLPSVGTLYKVYHYDDWLSSI